MFSAQSDPAYKVQCGSQVGDLVMVKEKEKESLYKTRVPRYLWANKNILITLIA